MIKSIVRSIAFSVALLACTLAPMRAQAATVALPPMQWQLGVTAIQFGTTVVALTNPPMPLVSLSGAGGSAAISFSPTPSPTVTANADGYDGAVDKGAFAQGLFRYFGAVETPGNAVVPTTINVSANASLFSQAGVVNFGSDARVKLEVFGTLVIPLTASEQGANNGAFTATKVVSVNTNQAFSVEMLVRAWTFEPGVSATAFLDPVFTLDQHLVDQGYTLRFSAGAGNSAVPLPAAFPLFSLGLITLAQFVRRSGRKLVATR